MFAIYNKGSVGFRSTADNLYELKKTESPNSVFLKPDDDDLFQEYLDSKKKNKSSQALDAYKKMANIDTSEIVYHVKDIMTNNPKSISKSKTIKEAYNTLKESQVNQIVVLNENKIIGLINKKTILNLIMDDTFNINTILNRKLEDIFLPEVIATESITDIRRVAKVMIDFKLDAIPVIDEKDLLVGIVSKTDIIKAVSHLPKLQLWS